MILTTISFILLVIANILFGFAIGRMVGHREMMPIINTYKEIAKDYKKLVYKERKIRNEIIEDYKKLVDLLRSDK